MEYVIYKITNQINNKVYIGLTSDYKTRKRDHICRLKKGIHYNEHLQKSWNKYGKLNFKFEIIDSSETFEFLLELEKFHIQNLESFNKTKGYNKTLGGEGAFSTPETRQNKIDNAPRKIKIAQYSLEGNLIKIFQSIRFASRELNIHYGQLNAACKSEKKSAGGFQFRSGNDIPDGIKKFETERKYYGHISKAVQQVDLNGVILKEWSNSTEAAKELKVAKTTIKGRIYNKRNINNTFFKFK